MGFTMKMNIYDGMNIIHRRYQTDVSGRAARSIIMEMTTALIGEVNIWCWEGKKSTQRRRELYPEYKGNRKPTENDLIPMVNLIRQALFFTNALQIEVYGYEADDAIASLCGSVSKTVPILIHSTDRDFAQLLCSNVEATFAPKIAPELVRLYKTFVGDTSDNIKGVPGFGQKSWDNAKPDDLFDILKGSDPPAYFSTRCSDWVKANRPMLAIMWEIVGFYQIPSDVLQISTTTGRLDAARAFAILEEFHQ